MNPPSRCCSNRGALFECCFVSDSNYPWLLQFQCPKRNIQCKSVEFDNIKIFYYSTWPDHLPPVGDTWNFYIASSGASPSESIDWDTEGIDIVAMVWMAGGMNIGRYRLRREPGFASPTLSCISNAHVRLFSPPATLLSILFISNTCNAY